MPHKMNARSSERINGFMVILRGHLTMAADLAGSQWNEGDVSCSVVRRVVLPDASFTIDGILETALTVLHELAPFPATIEAELRRQLPFLATTRLLMASVQQGVGRETAHAAIKRHALAAADALRSGRDHTLAEDLAADETLPLDRSAIDEILAAPMEFTGSASEQVDRFVEQVASVVSSDPEAASYRPAAIL
jgi:adenylosuccinate lyase